MVSSASLRKGDVVLIEAGDNIPMDGEVIEGVASVNEAAITGESAPVIRESGGTAAPSQAGTTVLSGLAGGPNYVKPRRNLSRSDDRNGGGAKRQKRPNEIALNILLAGMTIIVLFAHSDAASFSIYAVSAAGSGRR